MATVALTYHSEIRKALEFLPVLLRDKIVVIHPNDTTATAEDAPRSRGPTRSNRRSDT